MKDFFLKIYTKAQIAREDHGQDLIEYTLIAALIALGCVAGMRTLSTAIAAEWVKIATAFTTA